ncbi:uncharacterized protein LOC131639450 [Vicia villosa]|nr:uncharacterized protein LOC131639450 [Vicia villosa]
MSHECALHNENFQISCQAPCFHQFCGTCRMYDWLWRGFHRCHCPICDEPINLLIPTLDINSRHNPEVLSKINAYNHMFGLTSNIPFCFLYLFLIRDVLTNKVSPTTFFNARFFISIIMLYAYYMYFPWREIFGTRILSPLVGLFWMPHTVSVYKSKLCNRYRSNFRE